MAETLIPIAAFFGCWVDTIVLGDQSVLYSARYVT